MKRAILFGYRGAMRTALRRYPPAVGLITPKWLIDETAKRWLDSMDFFTRIYEREGRPLAAADPRILVAPITYLVM